MILNMYMKDKKLIIKIIKCIIKIECLRIPFSKSPEIMQTYIVMPHQI